MKTRLDSMTCSLNAPGVMRGLPARVTVVPETEATAAFSTAGRWSGLERKFCPGVRATLYRPTTGLLPAQAQGVVRTAAAPSSLAASIKRVLLMCLYVVLGVPICRRDRDAPPNGETYTSPAGSCASGELQRRGYGAGRRAGEACCPHNFLPAILMERTPTSGRRRPSHSWMSPPQTRISYRHGHGEARYEIVLIGLQIRKLRAATAWPAAWDSLPSQMLPGVHRA